MHSLSLSHNGLTGDIPPELAGLTGLHSLSLHGNELTGEIPQNLIEQDELHIWDLDESPPEGCIQTLFGFEPMDSYERWLESEERATGNRNHSG